MESRAAGRRAGGHVGRMIVAVATVAVVMVTLGGCVPPLQQQKDTVDRLLHQDAHTFVTTVTDATFRAQNPELNYTTDGCSNWFLPDHMNDTGATYDFTAACWHHDFGYRNYKRFLAGGLLPDPEGSRKRIDDMFHADMDADCAARSTWEHPTCYARSDLYYDLVRRYGSL